MLGARVSMALSLCEGEPCRASHGAEVFEPYLDAQICGAAPLVHDQANRPGAGLRQIDHLALTWDGARERQELRRSTALRDEPLLFFRDAELNLNQSFHVSIPSGGFCDCHVELSGCVESFELGRVANATVRHSSLDRYCCRACIALGGDLLQKRAATPCQRAGSVDIDAGAERWSRWM